MTCTICKTCGMHGAHHCAVNEGERIPSMRYRSARAAGLSHADAKALEATTGPMFFQPKATECAPA